MSSVPASVSDTKFANWIKAELATHYTKDGIQPFVEDEIENFKEGCLKDIRNMNNLPEGTICAGCSMTDLRSKKYRCPYNICTQLMSKIHQAHLHQRGGLKGPAFENTDASKWCSSSWEIAKCFMSKAGYKNINNAEDTDFNGIINVVINHKGLSSKISSTDNFEEGRRQCNLIRHSPTLEIEDSDLQSYLDVFENILTDDEFLASQDYAKIALEKLKKLRNSSLEIKIYDIMKVLDDKKMTETDEHNMKLLKDAERAIGVNTTKTNISLESLQTTLSYVSKLQALKEDLLTLYGKLHSNITISPLVQENDVPLADIYVQQRMTEVEFGMKRQQTIHQTNIDSYEAMFMNASTQCRNIFILAQAGGGKTTYVKRLCNVWCYAKGSGSKEPQNLSETAQATLERFDVLFLLLLRDIRGNECDMDEMIKSQIIKQLSRELYYDAEFLQEVLHRETCLVILDGLDEWSHPQTKECLNTIPIPHQKSRPKCTILSTTRPWKMWESRTCNSMIDKCIELREFDETAAKTLICNVMTTLTESNADEKKETEKFMSQIQKYNLDWFISTPVILIQLICLWHDKKTLGESRTQIYSNVIDFLLERAEEKSKQGKIYLHSTNQSQVEEQYENLDLLRRNKHCTKYTTLLSAVGKLAFRALFNKSPDISLVFDSSLVSNVLSSDQLEDCLHIGLLTENKIYQMSERRKNYSFMHKTFQEYFCALFVATIDQHTRSTEFLIQCKSVAAILERSCVFVFLSGLCPKIVNDISSSLAKTISKDKISLEFRQKVCTSIDWNMYYKMLKELQDMYIDCIIESKAENTGLVNIVLEDLIIDEDCNHENYDENLKELVEMNKDKIKSVKIYCQSAAILSGYIKNYGLCDLKCLDKVELISDELTDDKVWPLLSGSVNSLKCLSICKDIGSQIDPICDRMSERSVTSIQDMSCLTSIMLECFAMNHVMLQGLFGFIERKIEMTEVCLGYIKCTCHGYECAGLSLDLSKHLRLSMLEIGSLPLTEVNVNTQTLKKCRVGHFSSPNIFGRILSCLREANQLQSIMYFGIERPNEVEDLLATLPYLGALKVLVFKRVDLGDNVIDIQANLERIKFCSVQMKCSTFRALVKEIEQHPRSITCELLACKIAPEEEYLKLKEDIKYSTALKFQYDREEAAKLHTMQFKYEKRNK